MGETNVRFKKLLTDSAMDTIEHSFGVKLDRVNAKILQKLEFKGRPTACVIKKKLDSFTSDHLSKDDPVKSLIDQIKEHALDKELGDRLDKNSKKKVILQKFLEISSSVNLNTNRQVDLEIKIFFTKNTKNLFENTF